MLSIIIGVLSRNWAAVAGVMAFLALAIGVYFFLDSAWEDVKRNIRESVINEELKAANDRLAESAKQIAEDVARANESVRKMARDREAIGEAARSIRARIGSSEDGAAAPVLNEALKAIAEEQSKIDLGGGE